MPMEVTDMQLNRLAQKIEAGLYNVPADKVAEAILNWINPTAPGAAPQDLAGRGPFPSSSSP